MHVNKVHHVTTITRLAQDLGEDQNWLADVANEMEIEDGVIWVYGVEEDGILAFTDFGIENLIGSSICTNTIPRCSRVISHKYQRAGRRRSLTCSLYYLSFTSVFPLTPVVFCRLN